MNKILLAVVLLTGSAFGQFVAGQFCTANTNGSNPGCTMPGNVTSGHHNIVLINSSEQVNVYTVTDTRTATYTAHAGTAWSSGFAAPGCGGIGAICTTWLYDGSLPTSGADTIGYNADNFKMYLFFVGEYAGVGSFDNATASCGGGLLFPCNGASASGVVSNSVTTSNANELIFSIGCCNAVSGCAGAPTAVTGTTRASIFDAGGGTGCVFFDQVVGAPGVYTQQINVGGVATNWIIESYAFGFSPAGTVHHRSIWE